MAADPLQRTPEGQVSTRNIVWTAAIALAVVYGVKVYETKTGK